MNKALGAMFGLIGAILLLLPVAASAGPQLPGEALGTQIYCFGNQSVASGRAITISGSLARVQPLRVHGICVETLSITDTRVNITIIGDGGDTLNFGNACADNRNTILIGEDPTNAQIVQVRGRNITITGIEIFGQNLKAVLAGISPPGVHGMNEGFLNNNLGLFNNTDFDVSGCPSTAASDAIDTRCNNNRGIRAQRGGQMLLGRHTAFGAFLSKLTGETANHNPRQYEEKTGVCIHSLSKAGIEVAQGSLARVINSEVHHAGGDGILVSETSLAAIGFSSGGELNGTNDPFPGPGNGGPNYIHDNLGNGVNIQRNSGARIVGNTIFNNTGNGVSVTRGAHADVADNVISLNSRGVDVNDNSAVNLGTTSDGTCGTVAFQNHVPASTGGPNAGGLGAALPSQAGNQCPGSGGNTQNDGSTTSGLVNVSGLPNTVTVNNHSAGVRCQRAYIAGKTTTGRNGGDAGLSSTAGSFTSCTSNLN
jgi:parallel beta helix pectate lyase-like protein